MRLRMDQHDISHKKTWIDCLFVCWARTGNLGYDQGSSKMSFEMVIQIIHPKRSLKTIKTSLMKIEWSDEPSRVPVRWTVYHRILIRVGRTSS